MSPLATLQTALRRDRALACLSESHSHRAVQEDSLGVIKGRDAIMAGWVREDAGDISITADLGDMIAYTVNRWHGHRWVWRQGNRILREIVVEDRGEARTALPVHAPLGELRSGTGQYAASNDALLPPGFPQTARKVADRLHKAWNGRALELYDQAWLPAILRELPDATFYFEHAIVTETQTAILWRLHGHHPNGARIRLVGSSVVTGSEDQTVIDHAAMAAQINRETVCYA